MDQESAVAAQKKANGIIPKVGYPLLPNTTDAQSLASWYARLEIGADDFFGNVLRSTLLDEQKVWLTLGKQRSRLGWEVCLVLRRTVEALLIDRAMIRCIRRVSRSFPFAATPGDLWTNAYHPSRLITLAVNAYYSLCNHLCAGLR